MKVFPEELAERTSTEDFRTSLTKEPTSEPSSRTPPFYTHIKTRILLMPLLAPAGYVFSFHLPAQNNFCFRKVPTLLQAGSNCLDSRYCR